MSFGSVPERDRRKRHGGAAGTPIMPQVRKRINNAATPHAAYAQAAGVRRHGGPRGAAVQHHPLERPAEVDQRVRPGLRRGRAAVEQSNDETGFDGKNPGSDDDSEENSEDGDSENNDSENNDSANNDNARAAFKKLNDVKNAAAKLARENDTALKNLESLSEHRRAEDLAFENNSKNLEDASRRADLGDAAPAMPFKLNENKQKAMEPQAKKRSETETRSGEPKGDEVTGAAPTGAAPTGAAPTGVP